MAALDSPETERRRSGRTQLAIPLRVHRQTRTEEEFTVEAEKPHATQIPTQETQSRDDLQYCQVCRPRDGRASV
jgi:hypothetical protein